MPSTREKVPQGIADRLLADNRHTCCICKNRKDVVIHHMDEDNSNNSPANLCVLCTSCHSDVHSNQGLGRSFSIGELKIYKEQWEDRCKVEETKVTIVNKIFVFTEGNPDLLKNPAFLRNAISTASSGTTKTEVFQSVNASANLVAEISGSKATADEFRRFVLTEHLGPEWKGVPWEGKFLCYEGPIELLTLIEDHPFQNSIHDALSSGGFSTVLARKNKLSSHMDKGYRIIYLTDRNNWRRKITDGDVILMAKPKES